MWFRKNIFLILGFLIVMLRAGAQSPALHTADSLYALGNYTMAINAYAEHPSANSSLQIARAYNAIGNYGKAILQYENLLGEASDMLLAQNELGKLYLKTKKFQKAKTTFITLTEKDSLNPDNYYQLGRSIQGTGDAHMALTAFKHAFALDNHHLKSIYQIGKYHLKHREKDSVLKYVDKGLDFYPDAVELINLKALAFFNYGNHNEAVPEFERLVELGEEKAYIYERLGDCYIRQIEYEKAIEAYGTALDLNGIDPNPKTLLAMSKAYLKLKDYELATKYARTAIEVQKVTFENEYETLANIALQQKDVKTGLDYLQKAYAQAPDNAHLYYRICLTADNYYADPELKLKYYQRFTEKFGNSDRGAYYNNYAKKRISAIKKEMHMNGEAE
ncbi:tetratricopeptide repeat protein [Sinomicrobium weinanense]|uniref:Tetratricopeptide repeat protein n=1 Tax=Sinomicrobium weinanense TaxID=2842200 RepID=A0A926JWH2_9FLAO|nr:tetratricopeptide repeat protein [Sinomicrobium weinanense]MBC9798441.1 tetratricopeptide repeat protein [Sinomicrobium weinanense]MBU3125199.1 tetratricopeptide repeat protein [Sinomicrobium weinanense]